MKNCIRLGLFLLTFSLHGQTLRDINYNYLYNPGESFSFELKPMRETGNWTVFYKLTLRDTTFHTDQFSIRWELRESLADKENTTPSTTIESHETKLTSAEVAGTLTFSLIAVPKILSAKVINAATNKAWMFYRILDPNYPVSDYINVNGEPMTRPYVKITDQVRLGGPESRVVSYYNDNFPAALPPFAEAMARVSKAIVADSTFTIAPDQDITLSKTGLYLVQSDTTSTEGLPFRIQNDYPRLATIESLAGPLVYICTKQEYDKLWQSKNDKKSFDRVILNITEDTERAKKFMRSFFRRVELANQFFTSYKEGWKTDRGMIYIIFGLPEQVLRFSDREVWVYKNENFNVTFNFTKATSVFDPDNFVLIRDKKYQDTWYEVIDLWRNARF